MIDERDDRGVSDTIAFVGIFAVVIVSIGVMLGPSVALVESQQAGQQKDVVEAAFASFDEGVASQSTTTGASTAIQLPMKDATIATLANQTITVEVENATTTEMQTLKSQPISYRTSDQPSVRYASGGVFRVTDETGVVQSTPKVVVTEDDRVLFHPVLVRSQQVRFGGAASATLYGTVTDRRATRYKDGPYTVTITVDSAYPGVWGEALSARGFACSQSGGTISCSRSAVETFVVSETHVNVSIED